MPRYEFQQSEAPFMVSIADLMTSLAVVFILLLVYYIAELARVTALQQRQIDLLTKRAEFVTTLKDALKTRLLPAYKFENDDAGDFLSIVYTAHEKDLQFKLNDDKIQTTAFLTKFIPRVMAVLGSELSADEEEKLGLEFRSTHRFSDYVESILIEGHTDESGDDEFNLDLSQRRAREVMRFGIKQFDRGKQNQFIRMTSINGLGKRDLIKTSSSREENAQLSRRVEFKIRVRSILQQDMRVLPQPINIGEK